MSSKDSTDDTVAVRRSSGKVEELSAEQLEQINYERKVRDQESTGRFITPKQVNIIAASICLVVLVYALPRMFLSDNEQESTYIPLSERESDSEYYDDFENEPAYAPYTNPAIAFDTLQATTDETEPEITPSPEVLALIKEQEEAMLLITLKSAVMDSIQKWASDWSIQDVEAYLSHYSEKFISDKGMNIDEWREYRSARVAKPTWVQVVLLDIEIDMSSESLAQVTFTQNYSASNYQEVSKKSVSLESTDDGWKILSESNIK